MFLSCNLILCFKNIRLNFTQYFILKIPNKERTQQVAFNHSSDIDLRYFVNLMILTAKISDLSAVKIDKYEYLTSEDILLSDPCRIIGLANFTDSFSEKRLKSK